VAWEIVVLLPSHLQWRLCNQAAYCRWRVTIMTLRRFRTPAAFGMGAMLLACCAAAQTHPATEQAPYGGEVVESIIARVNDQIITSSSYNRSLKDMEQEDEQRGATPDQVADDRKNLL